MLKDAMEPVVKKILENASATGNISKNELILILAYQKECKQTTNDVINNVIKSGNKIVEAIDKIMGGK